MDRSGQPASQGLSPAVWIPAVYFVASAIWIALSDDLLSAWVHDAAELERWSTIKGWGFVAVTGLLFAWGLRRVEARQRAASAHLDKLERRARDLVETSPDAILIQEGLRIAYANPAASRLLGAPSGEALLGRSVLDVVDPSERAGVEERSLLAEAERPFPPVLLRRMRRLDGSPFRAEVALARFPGTGAPALQVTLRDVTQAWLLQQEVRRIHGALRTLGAVNEALVRAGSERELMEEVCRIAVDHGGFRLAWVGLPEAGGEGHALRPVAMHGADLAAGQAPGAGWSDAGRPDGLAATALRTGQPCVVNDLAHDARASQDREAVHRLGYGAGIALPISHGGDRLGALTLLAAEPDAFDAPVVLLLQQLVDDLAFGLVALRTRASLASEREFLEAILQNAGVLIGVVDRTGVLVRANAEYERLTGWPVDELVGRKAWERLVTPEAGLSYQARFSSMWQRAFPVVSSSQIRTRAGEVRLVEWVQTALRDPAGEPRYLVGIGQDVTDREQAEARLRESREQLRALAGRLQSVREEEKARMARDLHDELGQLLTGLKMDLRWLERRLSDLPASDDVSPLVDRVVAASELADQTVASVQRIAAELRPGALDRLGLGPALRQEVRRFQERTGIVCQGRIDEAAPEPPPEVATALYRICQEALTNVSRHAGATRVVVALSAEPPGLVLSVEDDGRGFEVGPSALGPEALGLLGMTERATLLGGEVGFTRRPGGGTVVTARVPLAAPRQERPG
jgi:PAS domain S-box-containing protein